jgi:5-amino-6-(5-phosphoribosylamino)uracil reductase
VAGRRALGLAPQPTKVTVTALAKLDPGAAFFTAGDTERLVYCTSDSAADARGAVGHLAEVVEGGPQVDMRWLAADLHTRGIRQLMVEGGGTVLTQFLAEGLADELQVAVAPFFVGDSRARRLVDDGRFPWTADHRAELADVRQLGDVVLLRYGLSERFEA